MLCCEFNWWRSETATADALSCGVGPSVGERRSPAYSTVGRCATGYSRVPVVTYSRSVVDSVVFQVRFGRLFVQNGKVQSPSSAGEFGPSRRLRRVAVSCSALSPLCLGGWGRVRHGSHSSVSRPGCDPSRLCRGDWRGVVTLCPVLKHGPRSARGARVGRVLLGGFVLVAGPPA